MRYEDTITLAKQGNSRCVIIPAKWLKENKSKDFDYRVNIIIEYDRIQIFPLKSGWELKHPSQTGRQDLIEPDKSAKDMTPPDELPDFSRLD
jgi:antitoxin component of MazEF toxin-antitoxin module